MSLLVSVPFGFCAWIVTRLNTPRLYSRRCDSTTSPSRNGASGFTRISRRITPVRVWSYPVSKILRTRICGPSSMRYTRLMKPSWKVRSSLRLSALSVRFDDDDACFPVTFAFSSEFFSGVLTLSAVAVNFASGNPSLKYSAKMLSRSVVTLNSE